MKLTFLKSRWAALFITLTIPFYQPVSAQTKSPETAPILLQGTKWPYKQPIFEQGNLYGRFQFSEGLAKVIYEQKVGFVDSSYIIAIPLAFEDARNQKIYNTSVVVDPVSSLQFQDAYSFKNSRAIVQQNGKWGVIDKSGNTIIPFQFQYIHRLLDNYFRVNLENEFDFMISGIMDQQGAIVLPVQYIWHATPFRSEAELLAEKVKSQENEDLKKQLKIPELQAIKIARKAKYYQQNHWSYPPQVSVNPEGNWQIVSTLTGYTKAGNCKFTNGCTTIKSKTILIDSNTGKILDKSVSEKQYPNYE